jgi:hypothetical protein
MRVCFLERGDKRWEVYVAWDKDGDDALGIWMGTSDRWSLPGKLRQLLIAERAADTAALRRRTKGSGG